LTQGVVNLGGGENEEIGGGLGIVKTAWEKKSNGKSTQFRSQNTELTLRYWKVSQKKSVIMENLSPKEKCGEWGSRGSR